MGICWELHLTAIPVSIPEMSEPTSTPRPPFATALPPLAGRPRRFPRTLALLAVAGLAAIPFNRARAADQKPLKVFILAGQSNMQGHAQVRTFEAIGMDPETAPMLQEMQLADGTPKVCKRVWISSIGSSEEEKTGLLTAGFGAEQRGPKIGPEFTFGLYLEKLLDEPILIIKTAWGGKSLNTDFRPPSAGPYQFNETQLETFRKQGKDIAAIKAEKAQATGLYYRLMMEHVKKVLADIGRVVPGYNAKQGYEMAGFVWFQGWNDMVDSGTYPHRDQPGGYDQYSTVMADFIRDVRKDLSSPGLPFVIGVIGVGGPVKNYGPEQQRYAGIHQNIRLAMAAPASLPEFNGNVAAVLTENYWDQKLTALIARDAAIKQQVKKLLSEGKLQRAEEQKTLEKLRVEGFTTGEREMLEKGISNLEFHYLGSAKILGQIGKAFAETVAGMQRK